ncbi:MAG: DUF4149 domain-containing protein [Ideonella sp.]|nr:DUF4149 domain-containing protein [Ideonella sp.]
MTRRVAALLAGIWAGALLCIGLVAAPAAFATLAAADAGRFAGRLFAQEAYLSLVFAALLYVLARRLARDAAAQGQGSVVSAEVLLALGALFCTVAGHFALQPMMEAARAGQGNHSFATLHGASMALYALKALLVVALAWRLTRH